MFFFGPGHPRIQIHRQGVCAYRYSTLKNINFISDPYTSFYSLGKRAQVLRQAIL